MSGSTRHWRGTGRGAASGIGQGGLARCPGFTLVELLAVLVLLGIVGVVAVGRFTGGNAAGPLTEAALFQSALRYAQSRSMDDVSTWGLAVADDGGSYRLFSNNAGIPSPVLPGSGSARHSLPQGVRVSAFGAVADSDGGSACHSIIFDYRGRPVGTGGISAGAADGRGYLPSGTPPRALSGDIVVTFAGDRTVGVTISSQTGFAR